MLFWILLHDCNERELRRKGEFRPIHQYTVIRIMTSFTNDTATSITLMTEVELLTSFEIEDVPTTLAPSEVDVVSYIHRLVVGVCYCFLTPIGLLGNFLVVLSFFISKTLRTPTNILVVNLAFADFLACAVAPFFAGQRPHRGPK